MQIILTNYKIIICRILIFIYDPPETPLALADGMNGGLL